MNLVDPRFPGQFEFDFRPATYWPELPTEQTVLSKIKGSVRRDMAREALEGKQLPPDVADLAFEEHLGDEARRRWGRIHPQLMGGEYLPDYDDDEVEIANIALASTTGDVIQVRARQDRGKIRYRVVDEYWSEGSRYAITPENSEEPLTFGELVELIDSARHADPGHSYGDDRYDIGLADGARNANYHPGESDPHSLRHFVRVTSVFYPELEAYYEWQAEQWVSRANAEGGEEQSGASRR